MDTMTWPAPTTDQPPPPPPKKKISKGWIILALVVGAGIIGAVNTAQEEAQFETDISTEADRSLYDNTSGGEIDETGYIRDMCAKMLDVDIPSTDLTIREGLANGKITVSTAAENFAQGYYDGADSTSDLTRSEVVSACSSGLRNG